MSDASAGHYDAFISYASVDRRQARRIQRFLELWVDKGEHRRLRVFLDETDIRGGGLDDELRRAAHRSRTLIICYSRAALESRWVDREIRLFRERTEPAGIAVAIISGDSTPEAAGRELVAGAEFRVHDLRGGRWLGLVGLGVKLELLRLLAFVADVDMRTLRNWHLRRTLTRAIVFVALALVPLWALLNVPLDNWELLDVTGGQGQFYAIAAEADGERLVVAARYRGAGPQGFRDYIQTVDGALSEKPTFTFHEISLRRRLLPVSLLPYENRARVPSVDVADYTDREPAAAPFVCEVAEGRFVVVVPLAPTQDEIDEATDNSHDFGTPIPTVKGSVVVTIDGGQRLGAEVADLSPVWEQRAGIEGPTSPSRGIAVAWSPEGDVWLGMTGRDAREAGGLWLRRGGQRAWERVPEFSSVQSIELDIRGNQTRSILVAEKHIELWQGIRLTPRPTRVVMREGAEPEWRLAESPPFGTRSEVELVGRMDGARLVRVDERIYRQRKIALWRFLLTD